MLPHVGVREAIGACSSAGNRWAQCWQNRQQRWPKAVVLANHCNSTKMGAAASIPAEGLDEASARSLACEHFDEAKFNSLANAEGKISKEQFEEAEARRRELQHRISAKLLAWI